MIAATLLSLAAPQVATLRCGAADLRLVSRAGAGDNAPLAPVTQTLTRRVGRRQLPVALEPTRTVQVDGVAVRNRYVASWACVRGARSARYVLLGYNCAVDPGNPNDCGGEKEWFRLLDARGRSVDRGVAHTGPAAERLQRRLGIAAAMAAGVAMTGVLE